MVMRVLTKKLLRSLTLKKGQFIAVVSVVAIGIMLYIAMSNSYQNLRNSQQDFYNKNRFADYYFQVVKAPDRIIKQIENVPGVNKASGRITEDLALVKADNSRATARVVTYDLEDKSSLNSLYMLTGRIFSSSSPSGEIEAVVDPQFMAANNLTPGDHISIVKEGRKINVRVVGSATGPEEFIYVVKDAVTMFPDPEIFGIVMLPNRQAQQVFNMSGQINQVLIDINPGVKEDEIIKRLKIFSPLMDYWPPIRGMIKSVIPCWKQSTTSPINCQCFAGHISSHCRCHTICHHKKNDQNPARSDRHNESYRL